MSEWVVGDVCLHVNECGNKSIVLVEKIMPNGLVCVETGNNTNELCRPDELHPLTADFKTVNDSTSYSSILKKIDDSYFLNRLCELVSNSPRLIKNYEQHSNTKKLWREGDICICIWSVDGLHYYARIQSANYDKDLYIVSYCYYENVESKKSNELFEDDVDHEKLVVDEYNITAASKIKDRKVKYNEAITEDAYDHVLTNTVSSNITNENNSCTNLGGLCTQLQTKCSVQSLALNNDEPSGDEFKSFSSTSSMSDVSSTSSENSIHILSQNSKQVDNNLQTSKDHDSAQPKINFEDLKYQPLLMSWFLCGYQTGYHEVIASFQRNPKP